ncbi:MAG: iron(III) transport system permease protein [Actinomycetota bacterium]|jgi:iron(III) transport system permease protein|nr:iron(III) transport system permease protein [Actinomycetota bacterium]
MSVLVALLAIIPLVFVIVYTIAIGPQEAWHLLVRPRIGELLGNTVRLVVGCVLLTAVIGTACAWVVERSDLPGRRLWHVLLAAPLAVPAFVNSFGWVSLTARVEGFSGALLIVTLSYFPLVYLPVAATLRGLDPALEETAYALGHGHWRTFGRVILPQLRPGLLGGGLLVGLHLLAEFGALQMLRFPTFTTAIYDQYRSSFNGPAANMIASVLVLCCLVLLLGELRLRGHQRYSRIGGGAPRRSPRRRLGRLTVPTLLAMLALVVLAVGVPIGSLVHWLLVGTSTAFPIGDLLSATATSLSLGVAAAVMTTVLALPVAWLAVRHRGPVSTLLERSTYFPNALPGIVVALALVTVSIRFVRPIYQTTALLLLAYGIMFLPRAMVSVRAALAQAPPLLDDVAHSLGTGTVSTMGRVTVPLIAPGLGAGAALVFLAVVTELTATLLLAPIGTSTLATEFWANSYSVAYGAAAPYGALMVLISMPATYLLSREARRSVPA